MTKNSVILRGGYDKGYKIFMVDENVFVFYPNLFVCILIISIKTYIFNELLKNVRIIK